MKLLHKSPLHKSTHKTPRQGRYGGQVGGKLGHVGAFGYQQVVAAEQVIADENRSDLYQRQCPTLFGFQPTQAHAKQHVEQERQVNAFTFETGHRNNQPADSGYAQIAEENRRKK